jgi:putative chitinase
MLLQKGSRGDDVKTLQVKLGTAADGIFGAETEQLVKAWQTANGLTADGVVGDRTWAALFPPTHISSTSREEKPVNIHRLDGHVPDNLLAQLNDNAVKSHITNNLRLAHFLSQCCHESGNFKSTSENLNYNAKGLLATFPSYFKEDGLAEKYEHNATMIASRVYANRMGNGDEHSQDGFTFRGRGYIQLTGKANYQKLAAFLGVAVDTKPDLVASQYALISAAYFFTENSLWTLCDQGASNDVITRVTKRINGGTNGLDERAKYFNNYYALLTA